MTGILMQRVQQKLADQDRVKIFKYLGGVVNRLSDERYRPATTDKIVNPLSTFKTVAKKRLAYNSALDNQEVAYISAEVFVPLGTQGAEFNDVEFIGGLWRVQKPFDARGHEIVEIRGKQFAILTKLDRQEYTGYQYFNAASVNWSAYGLDCDFQPYYIVAKAVNKYGTFYSFRCYVTSKSPLEDARAYLAGKIEEARYKYKLAHQR